MRYDVQESKETPGDYLAFAVDHDSEGEIYLALFSGPGAKERAAEYAEWKNARLSHQ